MKKWTYLVAALLVGGVSTSLTSCIDNDEPAGISDLRGAKAEFIRAKAAYEDAMAQLQLVKVERERVYLEMEQIDLQLKQLGLELQQAYNEQEIQRIQNAMEAAAETQKATMLNLQALTLTAQETLLKATTKLEIAQLTDRDNQYETEIASLKGKLSTALNDLTKAQVDLLEKQIDKADAISKNANYVTSLELKKTALEKDKEIVEGLLADYEAMTGTDLAALQAQKANFESQQLALVEKEAKAWQEYLQMKTSQEYVEATDKITEADLKLKAETSFTLPKAQVDAAIQEDFYKAIGNKLIEYDLTSPLPTPPVLNTYSGNVEDAFEKNEMIADLVYDKVTLSGLSTNKTTASNIEKVPELLAEQVKTKGQAAYVSDYNSLFGVSLTASNIFDDKTQEVKSEYATKVDAEKKRLELDKANIKTEYDNAVKAWADSYTEFQKALEAYGYYGNGTNTKYAEITKKIADAQKAYNDDPTAYTLAMAQTLRTAIQDYLKLREAVDGNWDGFTEHKLKDFNEDYGTTGSGAATTDLLDATNIGTFLSDASSYIGSSDIYIDRNLTSDLLGTTYEGNSTLHKYLAAAYDLFGTSDQFTRKTAYEPTVKEDGTVVVPDIEATSGKIGTYQASVNFDKTYAGLVNYAKWLALYNYLDGEYEKLADAADALEADKKKLEEEYKDALADLWEVQLEGYLIRGDISTSAPTNPSKKWAQEMTDYNNPYACYVTSIGTSNGVGYASRTENAQIQKQIDMLQVSIDAGELSYVTYQKKSDSTTEYEYVTTNGSKALETIIDDLNKLLYDYSTVSTTNLGDGLVQKIEEIDQQIKDFNENGWISNTNNTLYYDNEITKAQSLVDMYQDQVDNLTARLQKVLDAYAAAE